MSEALIYTRLVITQNVNRVGGHCRDLDHQLALDIADDDGDDGVIIITRFGSYTLYCRK